MNKFKSKFCRLLTPLAVLCLAVIMTVAAPMTSLMGALRVNAVTETNGSFDITNLPARYAKVNEEITVPSVTGGAVAVWHANNLIAVTTEKYTYPETGQYEWRFYADADKKCLINTYTVTVTQADYAITMPSVVPTVAPKSLDKLVLPLPEKLTADGEDIIDQLNGTDYKLKVTASLSNKGRPTEVKYTSEDDGTGNVTVDLSNLSAEQRVGTLQVTYILQDKDGKDLVAQVLSDIDIKNITPDQVTFSSNPAAPSVQNLSYWQEITLTAPTANSATDGETTFNVEATTKIIAVKFYNGAKQPSDWNKDKNVKTVNCDSGYLDNDFVKIDGLKVTTKQLGWYKFQFETTTLFGNDSANKDEEDGKYWSDAVNIKSDSRGPEFKFVKAYSNTDDVDGNKLHGVAFADIEDQYSKRYPFTTSSTAPATDEQKIMVDKEMTLYLPAIFAVDNATARNDLRISITVAQVKDSNGQAITSDKSNTQAVYYNNSHHPDSQYDPTETLKINFNNTTTGGNYLNLSNSAGLYLITLSIEDKAPAYGNGDATNSTTPRRTTKYLYFQLGGAPVNMNESQYAPTINDFSVSDVYLWEGNTFDFAVPTYSDPRTPTANLVMDYYLVNNGTSQAFRLNNDDISGGRMYVDLDELITDSVELSKFLNNSGDVEIYAIARNFTSLQNEFTSTVDWTNLAYSELPAVNTQANGLAVKTVKFAMHQKVSTVDSSVTVSLDNAIDGTGNSTTEFKAGKAVRIKEAVATFGGETDARISVSAFQLKDDGTRVAVDVVDNNADNANANQKVAAVAFRNTSHTIKNWYFTPRNSGYYQVVVTAKNNASDAVKTCVKTIEVKPNDDYVPMSLSTLSTVSGAPDATLAMGTVGRVVVPNIGKKGDNQPTYTAKNRKLYDAAGNEAGRYTITVKGVCDPDCLTGERFVPHQAGTYTFTIDYYQGNTTNRLTSVDYVVEVTADSGDATSAIKLATAYGKQEKLTNDDGEGTATSPKYAVTLKEFMTANIGGATNFIVDSEFLQNNLEAIKDADMDSETAYKYMYPAIAIPMPNLISGSTTEDVEITVQKSGYSDKLVSSKTAIGKNEDGSNKYSVIEKIGDYWVFRPDGKFKNNGVNYLASGDESASAVYVITYKTKSASLTFNLTIGNPNKGSLYFGENFLTYDSGKKNIDKGTTPVIDKDSDGKRYVTINLDQLNFTGNTDFMNLIARGNANEYENVEGDHSKEYLWQRVNVSVSFEGSTYIATSGWNEEDGSKDDTAHTYRFNVAESGTYTVTVSLFNPYVNQTVTQTFDFTIDVTATNKNVNLSTVWGIILVILSVGLLAGVIFYFVKTARETRFLDNPKAPKAKKEKKEKANKKVKDQKEDVK